MATTAMTGAGFTLTIGGTAIAQLKNATWGQPKWNYDDITNAGSPAMGTAGVLQEKIPTTVDAGTLDITGVFKYNDSGYQALVTAFSNGTLSAFVLTQLKGEGQATTATSFSFSGFVAALPLPDEDPSKGDTWKTTIQINTVITIAYGS